MPVDWKLNEQGQTNEKYLNVSINKNQVTM